MRSDVDLVEARRCLGSVSEWMEGSRGTTLWSPLNFLRCAVGHLIEDVSQLHDQVNAHGHSGVDGHTMLRAEQKGWEKPAPFHCCAMQTDGGYVAFNDEQLGYLRIRRFEEGAGTLRGITMPRRFVGSDSWIMVCDRDAYVGRFMGVSRSHPEDIGGQMVHGFHTPMVFRKQLILIGTDMPDSMHGLHIAVKDKSCGRG